MCLFRAGWKAWLPAESRFPLELTPASLLRLPQGTRQIAGSFLTHLHPPCHECSGLQVTLGGVGRTARGAENDRGSRKAEMELINSGLCCRAQVGTESRTGRVCGSPAFNSPAQPCEQLMRLMQMGTVSSTTYRCPSHNDGHLLLPFIFLAIISSTNNN